MGQYTSYYLYQKYESRNGQDPVPCSPSVYSIDGDGTMPKVVKMENDPECGYVPPPTEPIYRWYQIPITEDYICAECETPPTPTGETIYRWVESGTTCIEYDKWQRSIQQYSEDEGITWHNTNPPVYSATSLIEADSEDCGYVPPTPTSDTKFIASYSDGQTYSLECNGDSTLTSGETHPSGYVVSAMTSAFIGACVTKIGVDTFDYDCKSIARVNSTTDGVCNIPNNVITIGHRTFGFSSGFTNINIPDSVTSIGNDAFSDCENLISVTIGSGITSIGNYAFSDCSSLTSFTCFAITPPVAYLTFNYSDNVQIYVPAASVNAYKAASGWSEYASRIQAIP